MAASWSGPSASVTLSTPTPLTARWSSEVRSLVVVAMAYTVRLARLRLPSKTPENLQDRSQARSRYLDRAAPCSANLDPQTPFLELLDQPGRSDLAKSSRVAWSQAVYPLLDQVPSLVEVPPDLSPPHIRKTHV